MKKEIKSLTGLRGIAALYVAMYHFFEPFDKSLQFYVLNFIRHGYISVDMFFILSGFVITLSSKKLFDDSEKESGYLLFMKRRIARIYPIYIIITLIAFGLLFKFKGVEALLVNVFLLQVLTPIDYIVGSSWSLSAEWLAYLIFPFLLAIVYKFKSEKWTTACVLLSFGIVLFISLNNSSFLNGFRPLPELNGRLDRFTGISAVLRCFSEYIIGISIFKLYAKYKDSYSKYYHYAALPCSLLLIVLLSFHNTDVALVLLFAILIFSLSTDEGPVANFFSSGPLYFLGEISYSLYLIHPVLLRVDKFFYKKLLINNEVYIGSTFFITIILMSYLSYRFIELPSRDFLRNKLKWQ
jgi:peptidoglycan/LPS O-acetylase OafA/YrhL